jgi:uncharacterized protein
LRLRSLTLLAALVGEIVCSNAVLRGAETPIPPPPSRWVTDTAGFLSPETARSLDARLAAWEQSTGHQLLVYIAPTTGDAPIEDWAVRSFANWKVGRKGLDDGLVLFIMSRDRKLRIEVGYGLEGTVPDVTASRIINEVIVPKIRDGHPDDAVTAGIDALTAIIGGKAAAPLTTQKTKPSTPISLFQWIFYGLAGVMLLILLITHPSLAFFLLGSIMSGGNGRGNGGGFGGGGFGGGGGRSGGGGASGSW